jgi:coiled-coil domain-containing protein 55
MSVSKGNLAYGLNSRNSSKRKKGPIDILGGGDDDDGSDDSDVNGDGAPGGGGGGGRGAVNREIAAEQAALRKRAEAAMATKGADATTAAYDYDAEYDSFSGGKEGEKRTKDDDADAAAAKEKGVRAKPRYIAGLLRTAERRNKVYEVVHEKMVIREQVADVNPEYEGKETFVTSSYKRKMEEREKWAKEEEERTRREEEEDAKLRERRGGLAAGGLMLGVIGRNLLMERGGDRDRGGGNGDGEGEGLVGGEDGKIADRQEVLELDGRDRDGANEGKSDGEAREDARVIDAAADRDGDYRDRGREQSEPRRRPSPPSTTSFVVKTGGENATPAAAATATADGTMRTTTRTEDEGAGKTAETKKCRRRILEERATKIRDARKRYFERLGGRGATATRTSGMKKVDTYD